MLRERTGKPAVPRRLLLLVAGATWLGVGAMLVSLAAGWLQADARHHGALLAGAGIALALAVHHFGFLRVADRNIRRISSLDERPCVFAFLSWRSYVLVAVMIAMGVALRRSPIPKPLLAVLYVAIGGALLLSSVRYLRVFLRGG